MYVLTFGAEYGYETYSIGPFETEEAAWRAAVIELKYHQEPKRFEECFSDRDLSQLSDKEVAETYYEIMQDGDQSVSVSRLHEPDFDHELKYLGTHMGDDPPHLGGYSQCVHGMGDTPAEAWEAAAAKLDVPNECIDRHDFYYKKIDPIPGQHYVAIYHNLEE